MTSLVLQHPLGPEAAGFALSASEFDQAAFEPGWRYELIHGVLIVSPAPAAEERGPNELLGHCLLSYKETHPLGSHLDETLPEHDIHVGDERRRADRVIWSGLGRMPQKDETPTIAVEFVSAGKRNLVRDYITKRREYASVGVQEYWVFNRFEGTLTVFRGTDAEIVCGENNAYATELLPGFEVPLTRLFANAARWAN